MLLKVFRDAMNKSVWYSTLTLLHKSIKALTKKEAQVLPYKSAVTNEKCPLKWNDEMTSREEYLCLFMKIVQ